MRVVELGVIDDSNGESQVHENNVSPFFPHSEGFVQINCHGLDAQSIFVESSDDGVDWSVVIKTIGLPTGDVNRSFTVPYYKMGKYIRIRGVNITNGSAECYLIGG